MEDKAKAFIAELHQQAKTSSPSDTWYCTAAVAFTACNQARFTADVFLQAISNHPSDYAHHRFVLRRIREALLKASFIYGTPLVVQANRALLAALPSPESEDKTLIRDPAISRADIDKRGETYLHSAFRGATPPFLAEMADHWPDLHSLVVTHIYGFFHADSSVLGPVETSLVNLACLVPRDLNAEVKFHLKGLVNNGGNEQQAQETLDIVTRICEVCEVTLKNRMPRANEVIQGDKIIV